jgi:hypothetical protein
MNITIDGQAMTGSSVPGDNLEEILRELATNHVSEQRIIGEVRVNGTEYSEDIPHAALEVERAEINSLELFTRSAEEIAMHFIKNGDRLMQALIDTIPKITEMFRLGDEAEANEHFLRFLETLHILVDMLDRSSRVMGLREDAALEDHGSLRGRLEKLAETLSQLLRIQEQTDWIFLADILEYELTPELQALGVLLPLLTKTGH